MSVSPRRKMMPSGSLLEFRLDEYATERRPLIEERLADFLSTNDPTALWESMRYSVLSGGKRIRALLCLASAESVQEQFPTKPATEIALPCACAIEMAHAMSLIHDDLPCMDNDDYRRGKPTNHKMFGEAIALLAGDALLVYASEVLVERTSDLVDRRDLLKVVSMFNRALGPEGMVAGQVVDSISEAKGTDKSGSASEKAQLLESIHKRKTGALLSFSTWSGAKLMGADDHVLKLLSKFGEVLGLAFQIADDLLDVTGDISTLGKTPGKDEAAGKLTWVRLFGVDGSKSELRKLSEQGQQLLSDTKLAPTRTAPLAGLLEYAINRQS